MKAPTVVALRSLEVADEAAALRAHELLAADGFRFLPIWDGSIRWRAYVDRLAQISRGDALPAGWVPTTFLVGTVNRVIVGRISLRHALSPELLAWGGHVGYAVIPEFRGRGYAKAMLRGVLLHASNLGLSRVLVTCDEFNTASSSVIEALGGVLEDLRRKPGSEQLKRRYWIPTP